MAIITGTEGADTLDSGSGADEIRGLGGNDLLRGREGNNTLRGGAGNDYLFGHTGDDSLVGGGGADTLAGGSGNDTYVITRSDLPYEYGGIDTVHADFSYTLPRHFEHLVLLGTSAINGMGNQLGNAITGNSEGNRLNGRAGADTLSGGRGADTLDGGRSPAADVLLGGSGNDVLIHDAADTSVQGGAGRDTLQLDGGGVTLDLAAVDDSVHGGIERINLTGKGDNTLALSDLDLVALSDASDRLRVDGNAGDTVDLAGTWTDGGAGANYHTYTLGAATIVIDNDIFVT